MSEQDNVHNNNNTEYTAEPICYLCRKPESEVGKMLKLPNHIYVCDECMQRTFDAMNQGGNLNDVLKNMNNPNLMETNTDKTSPNDEKPSNENLNNINLGGMQGIPNISFMNLSDLQNMISRNQPLHKKKKQTGAGQEPGRQEQETPVLDINAIPPPHKIKASLDEYVVGQEQAKKVMSVAVYNHYKRVSATEDDAIEIEKSNMLMIGPTGSGKTYLVQTLAKLLDVPLALADATSLTEAGYIGDDIESVLSKLLAAADDDVERAEHGIVFIDEIDKIAKKRDAHHRDISGESVQQGMLKLLEGSEIEVPVGANSKSAMVPMAQLDTKNILFICGGAFPDLDEIIKERLNKHSSMGFRADLKDKYDEENNLLRKVAVEDVRKYGMIPEFIGRLPVIFTLDALDEDMMAKILEEPKNAILKQYQKLLAMDEVKLEFTPGAIRAIARKAMEKDVGARALRAILEEYMLDIMYEIPKDDNIGIVTITEEYIEKTGGPQITMRTLEAMHGKHPAIAASAGI